MLGFRRFEWPTVLLAIVATASWAGAVYLWGRAGAWWAVPLAVLAATLHSSLQHEMLHGHPTSNRHVNEAFVFLPVGFVYPYRRFKVLHLQHHHDENLTDPFEDPESWYMAPEDWAKAGPVWRAVRYANNTQVGRLLIGPALSIVGFARSELRLLMSGDREVQKAWLLHLAGMVPVLWWIMAVAGVNPLVYFVTVAYPTLSMLSVRTFIEHQAAANSTDRTIINEDRGPFAFLFLYNSLHFVHHSHPTLAWYKLPGLYAAKRQSFLDGNGGYFASSYWEVFRRYALRRKEPVEHPLMAKGQWPSRHGQG